MVESPLSARTSNGNSTHSNRPVAHDSSPTPDQERKQIGPESLLCETTCVPVTPYWSHPSTALDDQCRASSVSSTNLLTKTSP